MLTPVTVTEPKADGVPAVMVAEPPAGVEIREIVRLSASMTSSTAPVPESCASRVLIFVNTLALVFATIVSVPAAVSSGVIVSLDVAIRPVVLSVMF